MKALLITSFGFATPLSMCLQNNGDLHSQVERLAIALNIDIEDLQKSTVYDPFYYDKACWSTNRTEANSCTNPRWRELNTLKRAQYILLTAEELIAVHDLDYSPRILTCLTIRESCLRPQDQSPSEISSASGLTQVTKSTAVDLFTRARWFRPQVENFTEIKNGEEYFNKMSQSVAAQLELGLAVLHQKSLDNKTNRVRTLLERYYGSPDEEANKRYSDSIYECAACIVANDNKLSEACLRKARESCF